MAFELLKGTTVYKEVTTSLPDYWEGGVYKKGDTVITYEPIANCFVEPMSEEEGSLLPDGTSSSDSRWLLTSSDLNTYKDFPTDSSLADRIYLRNPESGRVKPQAWVVYSREVWDNYDDFDLIEGEGNYDLIIVREGKL